ncbi:MAG: hypothetical protein RSA57_03680 [Cetobacterium sp.]|uniref:hypothetical protein n=1 Tax=Bacteria TaxID=2 RepID=UPI002FCA11C3
MKKSKGSMQIAGVLIAIATIALFSVYLIYQNIPIFIKQNAQQILRPYIFKMEQEGYLSAENMLNLKNELEDAKCNNVKVTATNSKVEYGMDIYLNIEYETVLKELIMEDSFLPKLKDKTIIVPIPKKTVSKCTS